MGDATSQLADRLHLLSLKELLLNLLLISDIMLSRDKIGYTPLVVCHWRDASILYVQTAIFPSVDKAPPPGSPFGQFRPHFAVIIIAFLSTSQQVRILSEDLFSSVAGDFFKGRVDILDNTIRVGEHDNFSCLFDRLQEQFPYAFGLYTLSNVMSHHEFCRTIVEGEGVRRNIYENQRPIFF